MCAGRQFVAEAQGQVTNVYRVLAILPKHTPSGIVVGVAVVVAGSNMNACVGGWKTASASSFCCTGEIVMDCLGCYYVALDFGFANKHRFGVSFVSHQFGLQK